MLIGVAISGDRNMIRKEAKILKYKGLTIRYMSCGVIPAIIQAK
jgi:hypothetical protein